jgi:iron(III) transport system ATP-binding protein
VTALYVTHDQAEAVVLGDRIGVMRDGRLLQMAGADELYNRPADRFVANFTGASNAFAGRLIERQAEFGTVEAASGERLTAWLAPGLRAGEKVDIIVRPENIHVGANGGGPNRFPARIAGQRYHGVQTVYELAVLGGRIEAFELGTTARHPVGGEVEIALPPELCWAYPADAAAEAE